MDAKTVEPRFSVVVLNWNTLELLKRNLDALKAQSYSSLEVIVVDNGSSSEVPACSS